MSLNGFIKPIAIISLGMLSACTKPQIELQQEYWKDTHKQVVIAESTLPNADFYPTGAQGILEYAATKSAAKELIDHLKKKDNHWMDKVASNFEKAFQAKGIKAKLLSRPVDITRLPSDKTGLSHNADKQYNLLKAAEKKDQLLLLSLVNFGGERSYYSLIPLGAPKAIVSLEGKLIDLRTNQLLWHKNVRVSEAIQGKWNQKPNYPNFDKAIDLAIQKASTQLQHDLFRVTA